jgi:ribosomal protein S18 acetylase RimI-like enzyme
MCQGDRVVAYYSLVSSEWLDAPTSRLTKGMPRHPIPLVKLARLAVDQELQGRGIGVIMLLDALEKALLVSKIIGARAIVVDPINQAADSFYSRFGFEKLGLSKEKTEGVFDPRFILIKDIEKLITSSAYSS